MCVQIFKTISKNLCNSFNLFFYFTDKSTNEFPEKEKEVLEKELKKIIKNKIGNAKAKIKNAEIKEEKTD